MKPEKRSVTEDNEALYFPTRKAASARTVGTLQRYYFRRFAHLHLCSTRPTSGRRDLYSNVGTAAEPVRSTIQTSSWLERVAPGRMSTRIQHWVVRGRWQTWTGICTE